MNKRSPQNTVRAAYSYKVQKNNEWCTIWQLQYRQIAGHQIHLQLVLQSVPVRHTSTICQLLAKHKKNRCQIKQCHQANLINKTTLCVVVMGDVTGLFASRELWGKKTYRKLIYLCVAYMQIDTKARPIVSFLKAKLASQPSGFHISKGLYVNVTISQHNVDITANLHNYRQ